MLNYQRVKQSALIGKTVGETVGSFSEIPMTVQRATGLYVAQAFVLRSPANPVLLDIATCEIAWHPLNIT